MINVYWFAPPLVAAISLVYAASRHESWPRILRHALKIGLTIFGFMVLTMAVLLMINTRL